MKIENVEPLLSSEMVLTDSHFSNSICETIFEYEKNISLNIMVNSQSFNHHSDFNSHDSIPIYDSYYDEIVFLNHNFEFFSSP